MDQKTSQYILYSGWLIIQIYLTNVRWVYPEKTSHAKMMLLNARQKMYTASQLHINQPPILALNLLSRYSSNDNETVLLPSHLRREKKDARRYPARDQQGLFPLPARPLRRQPLTAREGMQSRLLRSRPLASRSLVRWRTFSLTLSASPFISVRRMTLSAACYLGGNRSRRGVDYVKGRHPTQPARQAAALG